MAWKPGTRLNQYRIDRVLGSGGFGITYKALHVGLNQRVVIKTINDNLHHDPEYASYVKRFRKEARILAKMGEIRHPHIVRVSDLFEAPPGDRSWLQSIFDLWQDSPKLPCLVMDFIDGQNLFERVRDQGALSEREALKYVEQAGEALLLVHQAGLVHRDAHPGNIMICNGNAMLIDFGLAGSIVPTISSSKIGGNPAFAPPDQWRGNRDPNVDIYTLAASLYFALTAQTPDPFTPPQQHNPSISDRTNQAIVQALDLQASKRPQTIPDWFSTLGLVLSSQALNPLPQESGKRSGNGKTLKADGIDRPPASNNRLPLILGGAGLALFLLVAVVNAPGQNSGGSKTTGGAPSVSPGTGTVENGSQSGSQSGTGQNAAGNDTPESGSTPDISPVTEQPPANSTNSTNSTNPRTPTHLGIAVQPYSYTTARVSASGAVTPYTANSPIGKYTETALSLPSNAVPIDMVAIPGGTFMMGSPESEADRYSSESPQHTVTVPDFFMGQYEVTQAQWFAVMGRDYNANNWQERWNSLDSKFKGDNLPIVMVSWEDAQEFCKRLSRLTGKTYRLPTEAEWEYAARAGTTTPFSYGETITPEVVNYDGNFPYGNAPKGDYRQGTIEVNSLYPNPWGLYHIHGNVWEWCADEWYDSYQKKPEALRKDGSIAWTQENTNVLPTISGAHRLRGGSWNDNAWFTRSAGRNGWNYGSIIYGFRVLLSSRIP